MAGSTRLELATSCVTGRRSNQLNYDPVILIFLPTLGPPFGGRYRIRTSDPLLVRQVL